jgi:hypothetical protein
MRWELIVLTRHTRDHHITSRDNILELQLSTMHLVLPLPDSLSSREVFNPCDINTVHARTIVRQQRCQRAADNLGAVNDSDGLPKQAVSVREDRVVDSNMLKDLDDRERCAREDGLLRLRSVQEADVLVHVEEVFVGKALDIFVHGSHLLEVLVLARILDLGLRYEDVPELTWRLPNTGK